MSSDISVSGSGPLQKPSLPSSRANAAEHSVAADAVDPKSPQDTVRRTEQAEETQQISQEQMKRLIERLNEFASNISRNLEFSIDSPTGHTVITVTERTSGELIREIPSEEFLKLSQHIQEMNSLLFNEKV